MSDAPAFDDAFRAKLADLFRWRRDVRHFRRDPLPPGMAEALLETMALAPSVGNAQPWRIARIDTSARREALAAHVDSAIIAAAAGYDEERRAAYARLKLHGLREAPLLLAIFTDEAPAAGHGLGRATMAETLRYSTVTAIHTLWLAAWAHGVGLGWVSILDPDTVTALLDVPTGWSLTALLCLGYPDETTDVPELERAGWQAREASHVVTR